MFRVKTFRNWLTPHKTGGVVGVGVVGPDFGVWGPRVGVVGLGVGVMGH